MHEEIKGWYLIMTVMFLFAGAAHVSGQTLETKLRLPKIPNPPRPVLPKTPPKAAEAAAPAKGDWLIRGNVACSNRTITLDGNLTVAKGACLVLRDTILKMPMSKEAGSRHNIVVNPGGKLFILKKTGGSLITSDGDRFNIVVKSKGTLVVVGSVIEKAGWDRKHPGLVVKAGATAHLRSSTFRNSFGGAYFERATGQWIEGNRFSNNILFGLKLGGGSSSNVISSNKVCRNGYPVKGLSPEGSKPVRAVGIVVGVAHRERIGTTRNIIRENTCNDNSQIGIKITGADNTLYRNVCNDNHGLFDTIHGGGMGVSGNRNNVRENRFARNRQTAIYAHGRGTFITHNEIEDCDAGIGPEYGPSEFVIAYNKILRARTGIGLKFGYGSKIIGNTIIDLVQPRVAFWKKDPRCQPVGIVIGNPEFPGQWNLIEGNVIKDTNGDAKGISIMGDSIDNVIRNNKISGCKAGIVLEGAAEWYAWARPRFDWPMFRRDGAACASAPYAKAPAKIYANRGRPPKDGPPYPPQLRQLWSFKAEAGIRATPVVSLSGKIYVLDDKATLYALAESSGRPLWRREANAGLPAKLPVIGEPLLRASPAADSAVGQVYLPAGKQVLALDETQGKVAWRYKTRGYILASPVFDSRHRLYLADTAGWVYALTDGGKLVWEKKVTDLPIAATPCITPNGTWKNPADDLLVVKDWGGTVRALKIDSGEPFWTQKTAAGGWSSPVYSLQPLEFFLATGSNSTGSRRNYNRFVKATPPAVVFGGGDGCVYALKEADGTVLWKSKPLGKAIQASPAMGPYGVLRFAVDGNLYRVRIGSRRQAASPIPGGGEIVASPAIGGRNIYVATTKGMLVRMGNKPWSTDLGAPVVSSPVVFNTSKVAVCTTDGTVRVFYSPRRTLVEGNDLRDNKVGLHAFDAIPTVSDCKFSGNTRAAIYYEYGVCGDADFGEGVISDCRFDKNKLDLEIGPGMTVLLRNSGYDKSKVLLGPGSSVEADAGRTKK